jgi:hypothetical protein
MNLYTVLCGISIVVLYLARLKELKTPRETIRGRCLLAWHHRRAQRGPTDDPLRCLVGADPDRRADRGL